MSDLRRIIPGWINTDTSRRMTLTNGAFYNPSPLNLFWAQQILFQFVLMRGDGTTPFSPPADATWYFGLDSVYTDRADLVQVLNADFIEADWPGTDGADFANGRVCWRVDLTGAALKNDLGSAASKLYHGGLWMTPPGEKSVPLAEWDMTLYNMSTGQNSPVNMPGTVYATTDMLDPYLRKQEPNCPVRFNDADGKWYHFCIDNGLWYPEAVRLVDGKPVFALGEEGIAL